jgi:hypothetical protein
MTKARAEVISARHGGVDVVFSNAAARLMPGTSWAELVDRSSTPTTSARRVGCAPFPRSSVGAGGYWSWQATSARCAGSPTGASRPTA